MTKSISTEAKSFADKIVKKYDELKAQYPHLDTICIDLLDDYPSDAVMQETISLIGAQWILDPHEFDASPGRAGCVWMTPRK